MTAGSAADPAAEMARELADRLGTIDQTGTGLVGVGIDAVDLDRFRAVLARRPGLARRVFTDGELAYAALAPDPVPRLATRFATKEAVMKALGVGLWSFRLTDVEVARSGMDAPTVAMHGAAASLATAAGVTGWHLSLTHTDTVALAVVVATTAGGASTCSRS